MLNYYVKKGDVWHDIPKTYQISIVDFIFDSESDKYLSRYQMRTTGGRILDERQNIIVIELPKIAKSEEGIMNTRTNSTSDWSLTSRN